MAATEELGPIAQLARRKYPFRDYAGVKDAAGKGINLFVQDGKYLTPHGPEHYANVKDAKIRTDDVLVCGYPKTGCHWMWETITMILKGKGEYATCLKLSAFLEMASPELCESLPSPRVLNTHVIYDWLPDQVKENKTKIVLTVRNPKDTAVSFFNHHINLQEIYNYDGQFKDWFPLFVDGKVDEGSFFDYHLSWEKAINDHPDHPILVVKYEEMKKEKLSQSPITVTLFKDKRRVLLAQSVKQDLAGTIRTIANFIKRPLTDQQVEDIAQSAKFGSMKQKFKNQATEKLIRKGEVADWKNWLTEEQARILDNMNKQYLAGTRLECPDDI